MNHHDDMEMGEIVVSESVLTEAQRLVEVIAQTHLAITMSNDIAIATVDGSLYTTSQTLFQTAIMAAYPHLPAGQIYQLWSECNESIEYCAAQIQAAQNELTHVHVQHDDTLEEMIMERRIFDEHYAGFGWYVLGSMNAEDYKMMRYYKK